MRGGGACAVVQYADPCSVLVCLLEIISADVTKSCRNVDPQPAIPAAHLRQ